MPARCRTTGLHGCGAVALLGDLEGVESDIALAGDPVLDLGAHLGFAAGGGDGGDRHQVGGGAGARAIGIDPDLLVAIDAGGQQEAGESERAEHQQCWE